MDFWQLFRRSLARVLLRFAYWLQAVEPLTKVVLVRNAAQAYKQAWSGLPDEWLYACYSGKLQAKLGELLGTEKHALTHSDRRRNSHEGRTEVLENIL